MTNPADEENEIEDIEVVSSETTEVETEEEIPEDEKPVKKKIAALKARHNLEDYFEMKKMRDALDYLHDDDSAKEK